MKVTQILGQVFTSALTTAILFHFATPIYVKDVVSEIECEKTDYQIIHKLYPSIDLPINISHDELHKKREEIETNYYKQIEAEDKARERENLLKEVLEEAAKEGLVKMR